MRALSFALVALVACGNETPPVTGGFQETIVDKTIRQGQGIDIADFDNDGRMEMVVALRLTDAIHLYSPTDPEFTQWDRVVISGPTAIVGMDVKTMDVDEDGDLDVLAIGLTQRQEALESPGELVWYENPGDIRGVWTTRPIATPVADTEDSSITTWSGGHYGACCLHLADLNGDGRQDLVVGERSARDNQNNVVGNNLLWYINEGPPTRFTGPIVIDNSLQDVAAILSMDVDQDGRTDLIASASSGQEVAWYRNTEAGFLKYQVFFAGGSSSHGLTLADMDNDQQDELVVTTVFTSSTAVRYFDPPPSVDQPWIGTDIAFMRPFTSTSTTPALVMPPAAPRVATADFDNNGLADIAMTSNGPGTRGDVRLYLNEGTGFTRVDIRGGYQGVVSLMARDINNDGSADLVTSTSQFGSRDRIAWWRNEDPRAGTVPDDRP